MYCESRCVCEQKSRDNDRGRWQVKDSLWSPTINASGKEGGCLERRDSDNSGVGLVVEVDQPMYDTVVLVFINSSPHRAKSLARRKWYASGTRIDVPSGVMHHACDEFLGRIRRCRGGTYEVIPMWRVCAGRSTFTGIRNAFNIILYSIIHLIV